MAQWDFFRLAPYRAEPGRAGLGLGLLRAKETQLNSNWP